MFAEVFTNHNDLLIARARDHPSGIPADAVVDYSHGPSRGSQILTASAITISAAFIAVVLRLHVKIFITRAPGWDDLMSVTALAFAIVRVVGNIVLVKKYGVGHHVWDVHPYHFHHLLTWYQIDNVFYLMAVLFAKFSILLLYLRIFRVNRVFRYMTYSLLGLVAGYCVSLTFAIIFACKPLQRTWDSSIPGTCPVKIEVVDYAIGGFNIFSDSAILILPIPMVWRLQISTTRLIGLLMVFGTGTFVVATSIIREVMVVRTLKDIDQTWSMVDDIVWLTVEINIGILCGCLPTLPPLIREKSTRALLKSPYYSIVNLLRSSDSSGRKTGHQSSKSSLQLRAGRADEVYLELVEEGKSSGGATSRATHEMI